MLRKLICFLVLISPLSASAQQKDTLRFFVTKPFPACTWDTVTSGERFCTYFTLTNDSTKTIILQRVATGDGGCYPNKNDGRYLNYVVLKPGEKVEFHFTMLTEGKRGAILRNVAVLLQDEQGNEWQKHFKWQGYIRPSSR